MGIACPLVLLFLIFFLFVVLSLHKVSSRPKRQFTIRGMMLFIFLWAVCLSQISIPEPSRSRSGFYYAAGLDRAVRVGCAGSLLLAARQFAVLLFHSSGVLLFTCLFAIDFACYGWGKGDEVNLCLAIGMCGGSFFSLSFYSLMLLVAIIRRPLSSPHKEN